jgi:hypothetical protein
MAWNWFDLAFPWIGGAGAVVLLVLMLATNLLRSEPTLSRWRDPVWMSWMATVLYLLHNVEEYGIDLFGQTHSFPGGLCAAMKLPPYPDCPIPPGFYLTVNIPLFWVVGPLAALLSTRHRLVGFALYSVISINGIIHIVATVATGQPYNPGLLTAVVLFIPFSAWVAYAFFGSGRPLSNTALALLIAWGVVLHAFLIGPMFAFVNGLIGGTALLWSQVVNGALLLVVAWLAERWGSGALVQRAYAV